MLYVRLVYLSLFFRSSAGHTLVTLCELHASCIPDTSFVVLCRICVDYGLARRSTITNSNIVIVSKQ